VFDSADPETIASLRKYLELLGGEMSFRDIPDTRERVAAAGAVARANLPEVPGVDMREECAPGFDGGPEVSVRVYAPSGSSTAMPGLLWMHGGGYMMGNVEQDDFRARNLVHDCGCVVVSVEYRLAPEHPYPAPLHDCYGALVWMAENAAELGVDRSRMAIGGASAGGGLDGGLALLARDRGDVPLAYQLLIYPMIDDRNVEPASPQLEDTLVWSRESNLIGWRSYLGREPGGASVPEYAAASRAADLASLPPAFISVGSIDLFVGENIDYARRLLAAGVPTELHVYPGGYHGFDSFAPRSRLAEQFTADRDAALRRALALSV
jgi:acetyl esterase/lipase